MKLLKLKKNKKKSDYDFNTLDSDFENFIALEAHKHETNQVPGNYSEQAEVEEDIPNSNQKMVYEFKSDLEENQTDMDNIDSLHQLTKREHPEIDLPYRTISVTYTSKGHHFISVYKKWTQCDIKDTSSYCYSVK